LRFWYIIVFAIGILFCFYCAEKYRLLYMIAVLFIILLLSLCKIIFEKKHKILIKFLLFFLFGFIVAFFKVTGIKEGVFKSPNYDITIEGKIENIRLTSHENILILKATKAPNTDLYKGKIRIKYDPALFQNKNLSIGDIICIKTSLIPIRYSDFPNDSSYRNYAKFFDIIATGHAKEISSIFSQKKTIHGYTIGILLSSIIATVSTVFFEIYHFKQYALIGLISNIPVIPITEFLVLPFGFIGMLFNKTYVGDICYMIANGIISQNLGTNEIIPMDKNNKNMKCTGNRKQRNMSCVYSIDNVLVQIKQGNSTRMVGVKIKNGKPVFISNKYK